MTRQSLVAAIGLCLAPACARPDYAESWPYQFTLSAGPQLGYAIKRVVEKMESNTLVGDDATVCRTSSERYQTTRVRAWIYCNWALPAVNGTRIAQITPR